MDCPRQTFRAAAATPQEQHAAAGRSRRHVKNFAENTRPLTRLISPKVDFVWDKEAQTAFEQMKDALTSAPLLRFPDFSRDFIVMTDASGQGLGAVLAQVLDGQEHPIAFASRQLNEAEKRYGATEQECLGVVWAVCHFRCYLFGRHFRVITDCNALKWLMSVRDPNLRLARWNLLLQQHSFEIVHRAGKLNQNADLLSRAVVRGVADFRPTLDLERFRQEQRSDDELVSLIKQCENAPGRHSEYYSDNEGLLCRREGDRRATPETSRGHVVVPVSLRDELLRTTHDAPYAGHLGARKTTERLSRDYYWPHMKQDVRVHWDRCGPCSLRKTPKGRKPAPLQIFEEISKPFKD
ncbi:putative polyprotein of retroviral origin [Ixodes scapularis]